MNENRFMGKAENYRLYRPGYPYEIIPLLQNECGLNKNSVVADIGAGTGIFTHFISEHCKTVYAVEPNADMLEKFRKKENIKLITATAENSTLKSNSVDIITAAQAFHWFDKSLVKPEFKRILKSGGYAVLVWNNRNRNSEFEKEYESIYDRYRTDYLPKTTQEALEQDKKGFFLDGSYKKFCFTNEQIFDFPQVRGRMLSSSYIPKEQSPEFKTIESQLKKLFDLYSVDNKITLTMQTEVFIGKL